MFKVMFSILVSPAKNLKTILKRPCVSCSISSAHWRVAVRYGQLLDSLAEWGEEVKWRGAAFSHVKLRGLLHQAEGVKVHLVCSGYHRMPLHKAWWSVCECHQVDQQRSGFSSALCHAHDGWTGTSVARSGWRLCRAQSSWWEERTQCLDWRGMFWSPCLPSQECTDWTTLLTTWVSPEICRLSNNI